MAFPLGSSFLHSLQRFISSSKSFNKCTSQQFTSQLEENKTNCMKGCWKQPRAMYIYLIDNVHMSLGVYSPHTSDKMCSFEPNIPFCKYWNPTIGSINSMEIELSVVLKRHNRLYKGGDLWQWWCFFSFGFHHKIFINRVTSIYQKQNSFCCHTMFVLIERCNSINSSY